MSARNSRSKISAREPIHQINIKIITKLVEAIGKHPLIMPIAINNMVSSDMEEVIIVKGVHAPVAKTVPVTQVAKQPKRTFSLRMAMKAIMRGEAGSSSETDQWQTRIPHMAAQSLLVAVKTRVKP